MAPKKKQQQQKQKSNKSQSSASSLSASSASSSGPKLHLSAENEQRLRRLLLNNSTSSTTTSSGSSLRPSTAVQATEESASLSRNQKVRKLKSVYERLSCEGFTDDQIERALSALKDVATFEAALDWLCLNLSRNDLPMKFCSGSSLDVNGGFVGVLSTAQENWAPSVDPSSRIEEEAHEISVRVKGRRDDESLSLQEPSQADWIRQYMEKQEEDEPESWEDNISGDDSTEKRREPRSYEAIVQEYQKARLEAAIAKEKKDKKSQEKASHMIRKLKQEFSALGLPDDLLSYDPGSQWATESVSEDGDNMMHETLACVDVMEHKGMEDKAESLSVPIKDVSTVEEASGDVELGNFFLEDDPSNESLPIEIIRMQKAEKAKRSISQKAMETLEGIWKKGDPPRIPKALLHQLCLKFGWDPPKYNKESSRGKGFNYTVSVLRKSTGRGKNRKAGGLITLQLPGNGNSFDSAEEAQNRVAAFALDNLFPDLPFHLLITEPYASLVAEWEEGESSSNLEVNLEDRRASFVDSLLDVDSSEVASLHADNKSFKREFQIPSIPNIADHNRGRHKHLREKESHVLQQELMKKKKMPNFMAMFRSRAALPIAKSKDEILHLLEENRVLVVCGETGSGKTTQVPQYILDEMIEAGHGGYCSIICTQPRRIAAISVAERVADERCEPSPGSNGSLVGYQVRLDSARNERTKLLFCTTGILLRRIAGDRNLDGVTHVVVDEVHERSLLGDFLLIVLKNLLQKQAAGGNPTLKVILMSATVDSSLFSGYFGGCPVITAEGRTHPVSSYFLEDIYERINYHLASDSPNYLSFETVGAETIGGSVTNHRGKKNLVLSSFGDESLLSEECANPYYYPSAYESYSEQTRFNMKKLNEDLIDFDLIEDLVCHIDETCDEGAILVFLPGISEIYNLLDRLSVSHRFSGESSEWILPLHSSIPAADQKKVFLRPPKNIRKVILATNIAETSLTIDDVVYVIDSGKHKENRYNPKKKLSSMVEDWISQANVKQRRGRAGRVKPGICFCLYTRHRFERLMRHFQVPEMLRVPLVELCLQIKLLSLGDIKLFLSKALEPPKEEAIDSAISLLHEVGAVDENDDLTSLGYHLAKLPVDLLLGKMMVYGAIFGCLSPILSISAFLSHKSPFVYPKDEREVAERSKLALLTDKSDASQDPSWGDRQSDHLVLMVAYQKWEKILQAKGAKAAKGFCGSYYLSSAVMYMIRDMRVQFGTLLADIGLINLPKHSQIHGSKRQNSISLLSDLSQPFNKYSQHPAVVKAIICAGLYPNVAATTEGIYASDLKQSLKPTTKGTPAWYDRSREVHIHPSSINSSVKSFQYPFLVYLEKVETNKVFLRDTTIISPYSLLLFGGPMNVLHQMGVVTVDGWLKLSAAAQIAVLFKELKSMLQSLLKDLTCQPERMSVDNEVVQSIVQLLVEESKPVH